MTNMDVEPPIICVR